MRSLAARGPRAAAKVGQRRGVADWDAVWSSPEPPAFHLPAASQNLEERIGWLTEGCFDKKALGRALVPLCGASLDVPYLASLGLHTVGIEFSGPACDEASRLWALQRTPAEVSSTVAVHGSLREPAAPSCESLREDGARGSVALLRGDLFAVPPAALEPFGVVWDRGGVTSLSADTIRASLRAIPAGELADLPPVDPAAAAEGASAAVVGRAYFSRLAALSVPGARLLIETLAVEGGEPAGMEADTILAALGGSGWERAELFSRRDVTGLYPDMQVQGKLVEVLVGAVRA